MTRAALLIEKLTDYNSKRLASSYSLYKEYPDVVSALSAFSETCTSTIQKLAPLSRLTDDGEQKIPDLVLADSREKLKAVYKEFLNAYYHSQEGSQEKMIFCLNLYELFSFGKILFNKGDSPFLNPISGLDTALKNHVNNVLKPEDLRVKLEKAIGSESDFFSYGKLVAFVRSNSPLALSSEDACDEFIKKFYDKESDGLSKAKSRHNEIKAHVLEAVPKKELEAKIKEIEAALNQSDKDKAFTHLVSFGKFLDKKFGPYFPKGKAYSAEDMVKIVGEVYPDLSVALTDAIKFQGEMLNEVILVSYRHAHLRTSQSAMDLALSHELTKIEVSAKKALAVFANRIDISGDPDLLPGEKPVSPLQRYTHEFPSEVDKFDQAVIDYCDDKLSIAEGSLLMQEVKRASEERSKDKKFSLYDFLQIVNKVFVLHQGEDKEGVAKSIFNKMTFESVTLSEQECKDALIQIKTDLFIKFNNGRKKALIDFQREVLNITKGKTLGDTTSLHDAYKSIGGFEMPDAKFDPELIFLSQGYEKKSVKCLEALRKAYGIAQREDYRQDELTNPKVDEIFRESAVIAVFKELTVARYYSQNHVQQHSFDEHQIHSLKALTDIGVQIREAYLKCNQLNISTNPADIKKQYDEMILILPSLHAAISEDILINKIDEPSFQDVYNLYQSILTSYAEITKDYATEKYKPAKSMEDAEGFVDGALDSDDDKASVVSTEVRAVFEAPCLLIPPTELHFKYEITNDAILIIHPTTDAVDTKHRRKEGDEMALSKLLAQGEAAQKSFLTHEHQGKKFVHIIPEVGAGRTESKQHICLRTVDVNRGETFSAQYTKTEVIDPRKLFLGAQNTFDDTNCGRYVSAMTIQAAGLAKDNLPILPAYLKESPAVRRALHFNSLEDAKAGLKEAYVKPLQCYEKPDDPKNKIQHASQVLQCLMAEYASRKTNVTREYHGTKVTPFGAGYGTATRLTTFFGKMLPNSMRPYSATEKYDAATFLKKIMVKNLIIQNPDEVKKKYPALNQGELGKCFKEYVEAKQLQVVQREEAGYKK